MSRGHLPGQHLSWQRLWGGCPQAWLSHSPAQPCHLHCCFPLQLLIRPCRPSCFLQVNWLPPLLLMVPSWPLPSCHLFCLQRGLELGLGSGRNQAEDPQRHQPPSRGLDHLCVTAPCPPQGHMPGQPFPCLQTAGTVGFRAELASPWAESTRGPGGWRQDRHHLCLSPGSGRRTSRKWTPGPGPTSWAHQP